MVVSLFQYPFRFKEVPNSFVIQIVNPNQALNTTSSYQNEDRSGQLLLSSGMEDTNSISELDFNFSDPFWDVEGLNFDNFSSL